MMAKWEAPAPEASPPVNTVKAQVVEAVRAELYKRANDILSVLPGMSLRFLEVVSNVIYVVIVPVLAFFFLKDADVFAGTS